MYCFRESALLQAHWLIVKRIYNKLLCICPQPQTKIILLIELKNKQTEKLVWHLLVFYSQEKSSFFSPQVFEVRFLGKKTENRILKLQLQFTVTECYSYI